MAQKRRRYSPEFKDEAVKMVIETSRPIADVARELGIVEGTLGSGSLPTGVPTPARHRHRQAWERVMV